MGISLKSPIGLACDVARTKREKTSATEPPGKVTDSAMSVECSPGFSMQSPLTRIILDAVIDAGDHSPAREHRLCKFVGMTG